MYQRIQILENELAIAAGFERHLYKNLKLF